MRALNVILLSFDFQISFSYLNQLKLSLQRFSYLTRFFIIRVILVVVRQWSRGIAQWVTHVWMCNETWCSWNGYWLWIVDWTMIWLLIDCLEALPTSTWHWEWYIRLVIILPCTSLHELNILASYPTPLVLSITFLIVPILIIQLICITQAHNSLGLDPSILLV